MPFVVSPDDTISSNATDVRGKRFCRFLRFFLQFLSGFAVLILAYDFAKKNLAKTGFAVSIVGKHSRRFVFPDECMLASGDFAAFAKILYGFVFLGSLRHPRLEVIPFFSCRKEIILQ